MANAYPDGIIHNMGDIHKAGFLNVFGNVFWVEQAFRPALSCIASIRGRL